MRNGQFRDRRDAGRELTSHLGHYAGAPDVVVLALPRGGVPVGFEIAKALELPLDVFIVRKLGLPGWHELAMGAIASGGARVLNEEVIRASKVPPIELERVEREELEELKRREQLYRIDRPPIDVTGRRVILVDDGLATGMTMRAAIAALRRRSPSKIVVAVPVAAIEACDALRSETDEIVCAYIPESFGAVGYFYENFNQTTDAEVRQLLQSAQRPC